MLLVHNMSLQTLLEAAKFLDDDKPDGKKEDSNKKSLKSHSSGRNMPQGTSVQEIEQHQLIEQRNPAAAAVPPGLFSVASLIMEF